MPMNWARLAASMFQLHRESIYKQIIFHDDKFLVWLSMWIELTGAIESLIAVLMNLLKTLARTGARVECPNKHKNTAFRVTSGPGREKYCAKTNTNWNSWNTVSPTLFGFFESPFFSRKMLSEISSKQRSWFFLLVHRLSERQTHNEISSLLWIVAWYKLMRLIASLCLTYRYELMRLLHIVENPFF